MKITARLSCLTAALMLQPCTGALGQEESDVIWFDRPADYFEEAIVIGNGKLGATIYGGVDKDRISLNDITLWSGEPDKGDAHPDMPELNRTKGAGPVEHVRALLDSSDYRGAERAQRAIQGHYSESYQPLGTLYIDYKDSRTGQYTRKLDLGTAVASTTAGTRTTEYLASAPDSVIVIWLNDPQGLDFSLSYDCPLEYTVSHNPDGGMTIDGYAAWHAYPDYFALRGRQRNNYDSGRGIHFRTVIKVERNGGTQATIIISNVTSFAGFDKDPVKQGREYRLASERIAHDAAARSYAALKETAVKDYRSYYDRLRLNLGGDATDLPTDRRLLRYADGAPDPGLEELYFKFGRYLLISCSRTPGVPANLQGLWNEKLVPPWSSNYTLNINLEENYWPAEVAALGDLHMPMLQYLKGLSSNGVRAAADYYGINRGWCAAHNSDIWAMANPVGLGSGDPSWANWNMGGAWLSTHIWEHWLFTRDKAFLREYYPILKGAAEFCMEWLVEKDGYLMTSPSTSPENKYITPDGYRGATLYGGTADIAFIRECLTDAVGASKALHKDLRFRLKARRALKKLAPYKVGQAGNLQEWYYDWKDVEPDHRHQTHLVGLYPGHQITAADSTLAAACAVTLKTKGLNTTGWSAGWRINLLARLHDSDGAYAMYRRLLRYVTPDGYSGPNYRDGGGTYPNLLDAHSPFQIDGNFGGCAGVLEMLIQSTNHEIWLLPACPSAWANGSLEGVHTRAGLTVSFSWSNGHIDSFRIIDAAPGVKPGKIRIHGL